MDHDMGYLILLAAAATPFGLLACLLLAMATGIIHVRSPAENVAHSYGDSWKSIA